MAENWAAIAAEAAAGVAEVGFAATLEKPAGVQGPDHDPTYGAATTHAVTVIDDTIRLRNADGTQEPRPRRVLTMGATGVAPATGDRVQVRGAWHRVLAVLPTAPGGVDLLFEAEIED